MDLPLGPGFSLGLAVSLFGATYSARQLLLAERRGDRLSGWFAALAFLIFSVSADLDLVALVSRAS